MFALLCASLTGAAFASRSETKLHEFAGVSDPYLGEALYQYYQKNFFQSLSNMLVALEADRIEQNHDEAQQLLGELYLAYGLHDNAQKVLSRVGRRSKGSEVQDRAWLDLAKANYRRGLYKESETALSNIQRGLSDEAEEERDALRGMLLLARGDYREAADVFEDMRSWSEWGSYGRYNYAIATLNNGDFDAGVKELERIGRHNFASEELRKLKDRANLALGFLFLRAKDPGRAISYLERVRLNEVHANKALLGIGWARIMLGQYEQALVPLLELHGRGTSDEAVLEVYLAVPFAFAEAGSLNQAVNYYDTAIENFERELKELEQLRSKISDQNLLAELLTGDPHRETEWLARVDGWPHSTESRVFTTLISDQWFHAALMNYQDLGIIKKQLKTWGNILDVYGNMLKTQRATYAGASGKPSPKDAQDTPQSVIDMVNARSTAYQHLQVKSQNSVDVNLDKIGALKTRAVDLQPDITAAMNEHGEYLKRLALSQVDIEHERIKRYLTQARFALAQIYEQLLREDMLQP